MSRARDRLRQLHSRLVPMPAATMAARENGELEPDQVLRARIRKVTAGEVAISSGLPPRIFALAKERNAIKGETDEEFQQRMESVVTEDPELMIAMQKVSRENIRAIVRAGVIGIELPHPGGGDPELINVELVDDPKFIDDASDLDHALPVKLVPEDLGGDYHRLYNEILAFSSLAFSPATGANVSRFPGERLAGDHESDGEILRHEPPRPDAAPDRGVEPPAGNVPAGHGGSAEDLEGPEQSP